MLLFRSFDSLARLCEKDDLVMNWQRIEAIYFL